MTPPTALATQPDVFPADVDPATIRPEDLPADGYGDLDEIADFEELVRRVRSGELSDDEFRPQRLHFGVYGIRQSTDTHMIRVKTPLGKFDARQFEAMAVIAERYAPPRVGHITTRQCFQFHRIPLPQVADVLRIVALAGLTTREACGNAIRNVIRHAPHPSHARPSRVSQVQAWEAERACWAWVRRPPWPRTGPRPGSGSRPDRRAPQHNFSP